MTGAELSTLVAAGALAAAAVAFMQLDLRVPGHSILRATLPIVLGVALVPRRFAGTIAGLAAAGSVVTFLVTGVAHFQIAAFTSLVAIGPAIDVATSGSGVGGRTLYLRFAAAGLAANMLAFAARWGAIWLGFDTLRGQSWQQFTLLPIVSYAACGIVAGLICGVICFRNTPSQS
jgi:hypothetical protein